MKPVMELRDLEHILLPWETSGRSSCDCNRFILLKVKKLRRRGMGIFLRESRKQISCSPLSMAEEEIALKRHQETLKSGLNHHLKNNHLEMPTRHLIKVISFSQEPYKGYGVLTLQLRKQLEW